MMPEISVMYGQRNAAHEERITALLEGLRLGQPVYIYKEVASTMDVAHAMAAQGAAEGTLIVAERQTKGRGRLGRTWESPEGGVYSSLILRPSQGTPLPQLSLVAGLALAEAIREQAKLYPSIRWPNDLLIDGKKVAGLLVEARESGVVVGIGINVTTRLEALPPDGTSLSAVGAAVPDPWKLIAALCRRLEAWYDVWIAQGFGPIRDALRPLVGLFGHPIQLTAGSNQLEGVAQDLDEQGRLMVRLDSGLLRAFEVGEVTLLR